MTKDAGEVWLEINLDYAIWHGALFGCARPSCLNSYYSYPEVVPVVPRRACRILPFPTQDQTYLGTIARAIEPPCAACTPSLFCTVRARSSASSDREARGADVSTASSATRAGDRGHGSSSALGTRTTHFPPPSFVASTYGRTPRNSWVLARGVHLPTRACGARGLSGAAKSWLISSHGSVYVVQAAMQCDGPRQWASCSATSVAR